MAMSDCKSTFHSCCAACKSSCALFSAFAEHVQPAVRLQYEHCNIVHAFAIVKWFQCLKQKIQTCVLVEI